MIFGGILVWLLRPAFEKLGNALAESLSRLGSGWGFKKRYLTHLIEEYRGLNIRGLKTRAPVTVELDVHVGEVMARGREELENFAQAAGDLFPRTPLDPVQRHDAG